MLSRFRAAYNDAYSYSRNHVSSLFFALVHVELASHASVINIPSMACITDIPDWCHIETKGVGRPGTDGAETATGACVFVCVYVCVSTYLLYRADQFH